MLMSLTRTDLEEITAIVRSSVSIEIRPIKDELQAIRNDIKEIYDRLSLLENRVRNIELHILPA